MLMIFVCKPLTGTILVCIFCDNKPVLVVNAYSYWFNVCSGEGRVAHKDAVHHLQKSIIKFIMSSNQLHSIYLEGCLEKRKLLFNDVSCAHLLPPLCVICPISEITQSTTIAPGRSAIGIIYKALWADQCQAYANGD